MYLASDAPGRVGVSLRIDPLDGDAIRNEHSSGLWVGLPL